MEELYKHIYDNIDAIVKKYPHIKTNNLTRKYMKTRDDNESYALSFFSTILLAMSISINQ